LQNSPRPIDMKQEIKRIFFSDIQNESQKKSCLLYGDQRLSGLSI
jgi:hypothetical protein